MNVRGRVERPASAREASSAERGGERTMLTQATKRSTYNFIQRVPDSSPRQTLQALATALQGHDPETYEHSRRVVAFSLRLARQFCLNRVQIESLALGALFHDIGKIRVPDAILHKPGKLTEAEWLRMRNHPLYGQQILSGKEFLDDQREVVAHQHEDADN